MRRWIPVSLFVLVACAATIWYVAGRTDRNTRQAMRAVQAWLELVDMGGYGESWDMAAQPLKDAFSRRTWAFLLEQKRSRFGQIEQRAFRDIQLLSDAKGVTGLMVVRVHSEVTSETCATCSEDIVCIMEPDGQWRVARYLFGADVAVDEGGATFAAPFLRLKRSYRTL